MRFLRYDPPHEIPEGIAVRRRDDGTVVAMLGSEVIQVGCWVGYRDGAAVCVVHQSAMDALVVPNDHQWKSEPTWRTAHIIREGAKRTLCGKLPTFRMELAAPDQMRCKLCLDAAKSRGR